MVTVVKCVTVMTCISVVIGLLLWGAICDISIFIQYKRREVKNNVGYPIY